MHPIRKWIPTLLGILLIAVYFLAFTLGDLRKDTVEFEYIFFAAFIFYAVVCFYILGWEDENPRILYWTYGLAALSFAILTLTRPTLSDDMYRYVWDGRVQAQGISPYRFPPNAAELFDLRDSDVYPFINRKSAVTIYPPAAEVAFALLWRIVPDNIHWFQIVMALSALSAGGLLTGLLRDLNRPPAHVFFYLGSPLLAFETAHAAHVDGLVLPFLVGAWWARVREQDSLVGMLLGVATAMKFYPALLLPFLWRPQHPKARWSMPLTSIATMAVFYLPYIFISGSDVLGFLPSYFKETFNVSPLVAWLSHALWKLGWHSPNRLIFILLGLVAIFACWVFVKPAPDAEAAIKRCILPIGVVTLLSQNLFSWYMLWLLPLIAIFVESLDKRIMGFALPRLDAWTGWWLFCGLIALSYTFFIDWKPINTAINAQFLPLYAILLFDLMRRYAKRFIVH